MEPQKERKENATEVAKNRIEDFPKQMTKIPPQIQKQSGKTKMGKQKEKSHLEISETNGWKKNVTKKPTTCEAYKEKRYITFKLKTNSDGQFRNKNYRSHNSVKWHF